ncbi:MAG TPA: phosphoadenylyl-sulfate reductase [Verrucomicrobiae bacterium]|jgi:phosphoadenosine phosphosulfate reductase|nr:phosphoadenylyl-sulfate reductase [Verrucomicrobiae bacterium]
MKTEGHSRCAELVSTVQSAAERWTPQHTLAWAFETFGNDVAISSAFGAEGMVLIDTASRLRADFRVFTIDTEFLFPETYSLMDRIEEKYGISIEKVFSGLSPEEQECTHGPSLWAHDPDLCCRIRKVEPLREKLGTLAAWVTSIRRDQTSTRASARRIEWDAKFGLVKINPIVDWNAKQVWRYIHEHGVPYNQLHDQNFPSVGCTHCTRAVTLGEDPRAGRWPGFAKTECGLHVIAPLPAPES